MRRRKFSYYYYTESTAAAGCGVCCAWGIMVNGNGGRGDRYPVTGAVSDDRTGRTGFFFLLTPGVIVAVPMPWRGILLLHGPFNVKETLSIKYCALYS
jgi:hypothetical protein